MLYFNIKDELFTYFLPNVVQFYCVYIFATFYIGLQAKFIKDYLEKEKSKETTLKENNNEQL
jgi:hypothetical protein